MKKSMNSFLGNEAIKVSVIMDSSDQDELDELLWEVLWKPLEFPRSIRESFRLDGPGIEVVAKQDGKIIGGIVTNWLTPTEVALRHIVVDSSIQNRGVGSLLFEQLKIVVKSVGCRIIRGYARNTSVNFFLRQGFVSLPGKTADHPQFSKHGISFQQLVYRF